MKNKNSVDISALNNGSIDVRPINFDFGFGFGRVWEEVSLPRFGCLFCDFVSQEAFFKEGDVCPKCENGVAVLRGGTPATNYYYPLPGYYKGNHNPKADQLLLHREVGSVVIVLITENGGEKVYALALSDRGIDLSWEICLAYVLLGYAPPVSLCNLPGWAGQDDRVEPFWSVLKACLQSVEIMAQRDKAQKEHLIRLAEIAIACPWCGHSDPHNLVSGCLRTSFNNPGEAEGLGGTRCPCPQYPEGRPADAQSVLGGLS